MTARKKPSAEFRTAFLADVELAGPEQERLLDLACKTLDEIDAMQCIIASDGYTVRTFSPTTTYPAPAGPPFGIAEPSHQM